MSSFPTSITKYYFFHFWMSSFATSITKYCFFHFQMSSFATSITKCCFLTSGRHLLQQATRSLAFLTSGCNFLQQVYRNIFFHFWISLGVVGKSLAASRPGAEAVELFWPMFCMGFWALRRCECASVNCWDALWREFIVCIRVSGVFSHS